MRKIFSSQRIETAEGVADLLRNAGIDVRMSNGRSYESKRSGQFSYLEQGNAQAYPTVWIVHADDQPRARDLLRDARLLDTTRRDLPNVEYTFRDGENGSSTNDGAAGPGASAGRAERSHPAVRQMPPPSPRSHPLLACVMLGPGHGLRRCTPTRWT
ncbi:pathogenicity-like protein [Xanthomonas arboricola pv. pruni str. MAFF 311562]|uniref:Pathogenicity-like protein n=1 Tax=Xanthomonas arboricola pv. pruni str. MAFF 311562 TaxID=1414836 RepID=W4RZ63_9XANT|nr:pathogenicity-like protein [Xanthomonas arboricola pv. pruni str. MAFF 311562]